MSVFSWQILYVCLQVIFSVSLFKFSSVGGPADVMLTLGASGSAACCTAAGSQLEMHSCTVHSAVQSCAQCSAVMCSRVHYIAVLYSGVIFRAVQCSVSILGQRSVVPEALVPDPALLPPTLNYTFLKLIQSFPTSYCRSSPRSKFVFVPWQLWYLSSDYFSMCLIGFEKP